MPSKISTKKYTRPVSALSLSVVLLSVSACGGGSQAGAEGTSEAAEDPFPTEQIEIVVPFSAGGGTDQMARTLANEAEATCGVDILVTNMPGASGTTGQLDVLNGEADGYRLVALTASGFLANHFGLAEITPDMMHGVMQWHNDPSVLAVRADSPYETLEDFLAAAEAGEDLRVATGGTGTSSHIAFVGMAEEAGVPPMVNVPYDGGAPAILATLGGEVDATSLGGQEAREYFESGDLRPLATMADERLYFLPDTPTLKEQGIDWSETLYRGLIAPADTPQDRLETLGSCLGEAYKAEPVQEFMKAQGYTPAFKPADEFQAFLEERFEESAERIETLGIGLE